MEEFNVLLGKNIELVEKISCKIESGEPYMESLRIYLPSLNQMVTTIINMVQVPEISLELNQAFVLQVLQDILYGIENEDSVFLLDVLRYGLLEIYHYVETELQSEGIS
ncbi:hypothetical protein VSQ32_15365 [Lachnospiraceae bacterium KK002]|uniref:hypothetical protein n=1 Tax=Eubacterium sp. 14-2 TaxID=1235790 RepID=UPI00033EB400|nr:hypothetical protein [Eubacterium sp. 14-2]EOT23610.1 hypothetical protein C805_03275 [Eubacterium sp. 14-2]